MYKFGLVYAHINLLNGKIYIGQTTQEPSRRFRKDDKTFNSYINCDKLLPALKKYGWDQFETCYLVWCKDQETLDAMEKYYIELFDSAGKNGYNVDINPQGSGPRSEETRKKISEKAKARKGTMGPAVNRIHHEFFNNIEYKNVLVVIILSRLLNL